MRIPIAPALATEGRRGGFKHERQPDQATKTQRRA